MSWRKFQPKTVLILILYTTKKANFCYFSQKANWQIFMVQLSPRLEINSNSEADPKLFGWSLTQTQIVTCEEVNSDFFLDKECEWYLFRIFKATHYNSKLLEKKRNQEGKQIRKILECFMLVLRVQFLIVSVM